MTAGSYHTVIISHVKFLRLQLILEYQILHISERMSLWILWRMIIFSWKKQATHHTISATEIMSDWNDNCQKALKRIKPSGQKISGWQFWWRIMLKTSCFKDIEVRLKWLWSEIEVLQSQRGCTSGVSIVLDWRLTVCSVFLSGNRHDNRSLRYIVDS